jgi:hypothetical protein
VSNLGRWTEWYANLDVDDPQPYGDPQTYQILADWVADCDLVEDWGCGKGYMRLFIEPDRYVGLDGTDSPFADHVVDLADLPPDRPPVCGIVMRHVIEHNPNWSQILINVNASFQSRFALALFTPMTDGPTKRIAFYPKIGVPDMSFNRDDITRHFPDCTIKSQRYKTHTQYDEETVYLIERTTCI